jgi:5-oxoprolinase (ATP-hydrolysing)
VLTVRTPPLPSPSHSPLTHPLPSPSQSQRVTDVVLKAFRACAASQGDCNNLTFGFGSNSAGTAAVRGFGYYETIAGGSGAGPTWQGASGVHVHMTNTRITDAEVFERRYPVVLREFGLRPGSGGRGRHRGGDGVVRDIEFRIPVTVSILSERRVYHPYGLEGGGDGACGLNTWMRRVPGTGAGGGEGEGEGEEEEEVWGSEDQDNFRAVNLGAKNSADMKPGERIIVMTPGGGAWGPEGEESGIVARIDPKQAWRGGSIAGRQAVAEASA